MRILAPRSSTCLCGRGTLPRATLALDPGRNICALAFNLVAGERSGPLAPASALALALAFSWCGLAAPKRVAQRLAQRKLPACAASVLHARVHGLVSNSLAC